LVGGGVGGSGVLPWPDPLLEHCPQKNSTNKHDRKIGIVLFIMDIVLFILIEDDLGNRAFLTPFIMG